MRFSLCARFVRISRSHDGAMLEQAIQTSAWPCSSQSMEDRHRRVAGWLADVSPERESSSYLLEYPLEYMHRASSRCRPRRAGPMRSLSTSGGGALPEGLWWPSRPLPTPR